MCVFGGTCAHMYACRGQRKTLRVIPRDPSHLLFEIGLLLAWGSLVANVAGSARQPEDQAVSLSLVLGFQYVSLALG